MRRVVVVEHESSDGVRGHVAGCMLVVGVHVVNLGPDAMRYLYAGKNVPVPRPFNLRWLLPAICRTKPVRWWMVWAAAWPLLAGSMVWWRVVAGDGWTVAVAAAALLVGLPGILGPAVSIPIQVDLPATALVVFGCAVSQYSMIAGVGVFVLAATIRETAPIVAALWLWSLWPLIALFPVIVAMILIRPGSDPLGGELQRIADHPIRTALEYHAGRWRDGWLMVAPWGVCLAGLYGADWRLVTVIGIAYLQLLVATDTVRLVQHVAGVPLVIAAATVIPPNWLVLAVVAHIMWWRQPERI